MGKYKINRHLSHGVQNPILSPSDKTLASPVIKYLAFHVGKCTPLPMHGHVKHVCVMVQEDNFTSCGWAWRSSEGMFAAPKETWVSLPAPVGPVICKSRAITFAVIAFELNKLQKWTCFSLNKGAFVNLASILAHLIGLAPAKYIFFSMPAMNRTEWCHHNNALIRPHRTGWLLNSVNKHQ